MSKVPFLTTIGGIVVGYALVSPWSAGVFERGQPGEAIRISLLVAAMGLLLVVLTRTIRQKSEKIKEDKEYIDLMIDSMDEGLLSIGRDYRIIRANRAYLKQVGEERADRVEGGLCYRVSHKIDTPCYEAGEDCPVRKVFETGASAQASHLHRDNKGRAVCVELSAYPVRDAGGNVIQALEVVRNVTKQRMTEEALRRSTEELRRSNLSKELFTDILSHDLLNPVGVIKYMADSLAADPGIKDQEQLLLLMRSVQKLQEMIQNAAKYAHLERADCLEMSALDLTAVLQAVISGFQPFAREKEMSIAFDAPHEARALANPMIEDVFTNLISNAIKYSPAGTAIVVALADGGDRWSISVADRGAGIPVEFRESIFERFVRREKGGVKGSGLGLAIAKRIVVAHGGFIGVEDNPGGGSIFAVQIPKSPVRAHQEV